jgi:hypothetical protein
LVLVLLETQKVATLFVAQSHLLVAELVDTQVQA